MHFRMKSEEVERLNKVKSFERTYLGKIIRYFMAEGEFLHDLISAVGSPCVTQYLLCVRNRRLYFVSSNWANLLLEKYLIEIGIREV